MLTPVKKKVVATKNFVKKHRVAIAVTATSIVWVTLQFRTANEFNKFLRERGLFDEYYYQPETEEEAIALNA